MKQVRRVGDYRHDFSGQKLLHCQSSVREHCHGEWTSPDSVMVPNVFGRLTPSDIAKSPISNACWLFSLEEQIFDEQCPHSQKRSRWCLTCFTLLSSDDERTGCATERTVLWFLCYNSKARFHLLHSWCSLKQNFMQVYCIYELCGIYGFYFLLQQQMPMGSSAEGYGCKNR
jgi:hypothetical protein